MWPSYLTPWLSSRIGAADTTLPIFHGLYRRSALGRRGPGV